MLCFLGLAGEMAGNMARAEPPPGALAASEVAPHFNVETYVVDDDGLMPTNVWVPILSKYTGTNVSLEEIVQGASELQAEYRERGHPQMSIAIAREQIANGVATLNVFQTVIPQVVVSGVRYSGPTNGEVAASLPAIAPVLVPATATTATNAAETTDELPFPPRTIERTGGMPVPLTPNSAEQIAQARANLFREFAKMEAAENDTRLHVVSTNAGPRFEVERYRITGNTILPPQTLAGVLTNIDGDYGTNVSIEGIRTVVEQLQLAYRERGYVTVAVGLPKQRLTNATVKVQVTEGRLEAIDVEGNRYFSSNNVMRALPSLHTNIILNANILQAELNRANASQDRQIYPVIGPGPDPGTSDLALHVKDQLPLHAKLELNNQNSPGTPDLRVNGSAVYDNLWQEDQSLGVQYGFSPEEYKRAARWNFYDEPMVANYSVFYRLPLGNPEPADDVVADNSSFGYDEATRKFNLPPLSSNPDLTFFAGRSTIDTGVTPTSSKTFSVNSSSSAGSTNEDIFENDVDQDWTINNDIGTRLTIPLQKTSTFESVFSGGLDFKTYYVSSGKTNIFNVNGIEIDYSDKTTNAIDYTDVSPVPYTIKQMYYTPLSLRYDATWQDAYGITTFGLGVNVNLWYWSKETTEPADTNNIYLYGRKALQQITGSMKSEGHWVALMPSFSRTIVINNWTTVIRGNAQWASEPLISNEQFGLGGVNSVRGYHEGEVFGDNGWQGTLEEDTPPHTIGFVTGAEPLTIRGSIYSDAGGVYLEDPQGRPGSTVLWGTGLGFEMGVGTHWQAQFLFSLPMVSTALVPRYQPYFNFALTGQF